MQLEDLLADERALARQRLHREHEGEAMVCRGTEQVIEALARMPWGESMRLLRSGEGHWRLVTPQGGRVSRVDMSVLVQVDDLGEALEELALAQVSGHYPRISVATAVQTLGACR